MSMPEVFTSHAAREQLPSTLKRFRDEGISAEPLVFGPHRKAEAVVIPFELYSKLLPAIEEIEIAELIRERSAAGDATPLSDLAESIGLDPTDYQ